MIGSGPSGCTTEVICWDFDGLLVDTETAEFNVWRDVLAGLGVSMDLAEYLPFVGTRETTNLVIEFAQRRGLSASPGEVRDMVRQRYQAATERLPLRAGVEALLTNARERGVVNWIVSSSSAKTIRNTIERTGVEWLIGGIVGFESTQRHKPTPDPYLEALRLTGCAPVAARALEDSVTGVASAVAAGVPVAAVTNPITKGSVFPSMVSIFDEVHEVPLDWLFTERSVA